MKKVFIGIDPGQTGAMAVIPGDDASNIVVWDFNEPGALDFLQSIQLVGIKAKAVLELVHSFPGQGVSSTFKFGTNFGVWLGRLEALNVPYDLITPQKWQKEVFDYQKAPGKKHDRKAMSLERAKRIYPQTGKYLTRKMDHNRADAILIAEYCRRISV